MKMPINCPICGEILVFRSLPQAGTTSKWDKGCSKKLGHRLEFAGSLNSNCDENEIAWIRLYVDDAIISWYPGYEDGLGNVVAPYVRLGSKKINDTIILPWFEPDFSNYPQLLKKIKTYKIFS
jgi:hypothetical protein